MELKVLVADDHSIVRVGLALLLKDMYPRAFILECKDFKEVLGAADLHSFNLVILDVNMANGNYQDTVDVLKRKIPEVRILVFSSLDEQLYAVRYLQMGADGFLHKMAGEDEVKQAVGQVLDTGQYISEKVKRTLVDASLSGDKQHKDPMKILSNRELDIATMLIQGLSLTEISNKLNLHVATISTYKTRIFHKMGISRLPELIERFRMYGVTPGDK